MHFLSQKYQNFPKVLGYDATKLGIIIEYFPCGPLSLWIQKRVISKSQCVGLLSGIAIAIQNIHSENVAHCDIKSDNVLIELDPRDDRLVPKVTDFGISQIVADDLIRVHAYHAVHVKGMSVSYAAPEMIYNYRSGGSNRQMNLKAADVYSFGCVIFEVSNVRRPWTVE